MARAVVFDIGNVLIEWQPERFFDREIGVDARKAMFADVDLHAMNDLVDQGQNWRDTVYSCADAHPKHAQAIRLWHDRWLEMASPAIDPCVDLLRALRQNNVPVLALSNFGIETFALAEKAYPFLSEFDQRWISGHLGVTKPDPRIYQMLEETCGFAPHDLLFADDRAENIDAAATRGWATHLFEGAEGWAKRLVEEGLLPFDTANQGKTP